MFGYTKLTEEEKAEHARNRRLAELASLIEKEGAVRAESLIKAQSYQEELDKLSGG